LTKAIIKYRNVSGFGRFFLARKIPEQLMNYPRLPKWQLLALPAVTLMLGIFYFSKYFVVDELIYANYKLEVLEQDLLTALDALEAEKARVTLLEREVDVVRRANALLRGSERERQDEIASLQADLAFYRRLGGANGSQAPLAVHHLELQTTQSTRVYRLIFTLTQNLRWTSVISGRVELSVDGIRKGIAENVTEAHLLAESSEPLKFEFKYFQQLERLITLPEGFEANRLTIRLKSDSLRTAVEQSMDWEDLFNQTAKPVSADEELPLSQDD
jgi:hypothetical protein